MLATLIFAIIITSCAAYYFFITINSKIGKYTPRNIVSALLLFDKSLQTPDKFARTFSDMAIFSHTMRSELPWLRDHYHNMAQQFDSDFKQIVKTTESTQRLSILQIDGLSASRADIGRYQSFTAFAKLECKNVSSEEAWNYINHDFLANEIFIYEFSDIGKRYWSNRNGSHRFAVAHCNVKLNNKKNRFFTAKTRAYWLDWSLLHRLTSKFHMFILPTNLCTEIFKQNLPFMPLITVGTGSAILLNYSKVFGSEATIACLPKKNVIAHIVSGHLQRHQFPEFITALRNNVAVCKKSSPPS